MRIRFPDGRQTILTYCTNVHAIEDLASLLAALPRYCAPVRRRLGVRRLSLGLWLSRRSASALAASPDARARLREALETNGLELVTLNGFPYGDFHAERVKEEVTGPTSGAIAIRSTSRTSSASCSRPTSRRGRSRRCH